MSRIGVLVGLGFLLLLASCTPQPCPQDGMVYIPEGWFLMGENDGRRSNQPQHAVYLDAFCIQRTEVTRRDFIRYMKASGTEVMGLTFDQMSKSGKLPVVNVLWGEADAYCRWSGLRLPTEAEWEKAARGVDGRRYPWGDAWEARLANTAESGYKDLLPASSYPQGASPYGALDMAGNAAEWVADYFSFDYYQVSPERNPTGPTQVLDHSLRGGSYASPHEQATTYFRDSSHSARPNLRTGFRCAANIK